MKINISLLVLILISACSPFNEERVKDYSGEIQSISLKLEKYDDGIYDRDDIDEFIIDDIRKFGIDLVIVNKGRINNRFSGFIEESDSLVILIKKAESIFSKERRIIYDFSKAPRNFGNEKIQNASYKLQQVNDRIYYSEVGFD